MTPPYTWDWACVPGEQGGVSALRWGARRTLRPPPEPRASHAAFTAHNRAVKRCCCPAPKVSSHRGTGVDLRCAPQGYKEQQHLQLPEDPCLPLPLSSVSPLSAGVGTGCSNAQPRRTELHRVSQLPYTICALQQQQLSFFCADKADNNSLLHRDPLQLPGGSGSAPKAGGFAAGAAGISPGQQGRSERLQGWGSVHVSGLPLRVSRVPLHSSHGEWRDPHHEAHRDLPPRCPAAAADTELGRGAGKASPTPVTPWGSPAGAKEQHQPVSGLLPPSQTERTSKAIFKVSLA